MRRDSKNKLLIVAGTILATAMGCGSLASAEHPGLASPAQPPTTDPSNLAVELDTGWLERDGSIEVFLVNEGRTPWVQPWFEPGARCLESSMVVHSEKGEPVRDATPCDPRLAYSGDRYLAPGDRLLIGRIDARDLSDAPAGTYFVEVPVSGAVLHSEFDLAEPRKERNVNILNGGMHVLQLSVELAKAGQK